ncbi:155_t:CDS:2 [Funneliformis geosporum]|uniref:155_t:CDS:1 n=1 Tax=Funneliformis geosporum TaxID=1117311 RepID=A0A9W4X385_9GLOM|nr:155_t:CDS:2 [Funneliformis geosporum]
MPAKNILANSLFEIKKIPNIAPKSEIATIFPPKKEIKTFAELYEAYPSLLTPSKIKCPGCKAKRIGKDKLILCDSRCFVKNWIKDHGYLNSKNREEILAYFTFKDLPKLTQELFRDFSKHSKKKKNRKLNRHKDKCYIQNHYREKVLIEIMASKNYLLVEKSVAKESENYLKFPLKKVVYKNSSYSSYIYKTCFFYYTPTHTSTYDRANNSNNASDLIVHLERNKNNNPSNENAKEKTNKNNPPNTKIWENYKSIKIIGENANYAVLLPEFLRKFITKLNRLWEEELKVRGSNYVEGKLLNKFRRLTFEEKFSRGKELSVLVEVDAQIIAIAKNERKYKEKRTKYSLLINEEINKGILIEGMGLNSQYERQEKYLLSMLAGINLVLFWAIGWWFSKITVNCLTYGNYSASVQRINDFLQLSEKNDNLEKLKLTKEIKSITFENVSFKYQNNQEWVLRSHNETFQAKKINRLSGENGKGKSTILYLILGLIKPDSGQITITDIQGQNYNLPQDINLQA